MGEAITIETLEQINQYLLGKLNEDELLIFEKKLADDPQLFQEVMMQQQLFHIHGVSTRSVPNTSYDPAVVASIKSKLNSEEYQTLSNSIKNARKSYEKQPISIARKSSFKKYFLAASIALIMGIMFFINQYETTESYYKKYAQWNDLPSFIEKGVAANLFVKGELLFKEKKYQEAITTLSTIDNKDVYYPFALMYIGASYDKLNENAKAIATFQRLSQLTSFEEYSKGYWYEFLIHLKMSNQEEAKKVQSIILKDSSNYNYAIAKDIEL